MHNYRCWPLSWRSAVVRAGVERTATQGCFVLLDHLRANDFSEQKRKDTKTKFFFEQRKKLNTSLLYKRWVTSTRLTPTLVAKKKNRKKERSTYFLYSSFPQRYYATGVIGSNPSIHYMMPESEAPGDKAERCPWRGLLLLKKVIDVRRRHHTCTPSRRTMESKRGWLRVVWVLAWSRQVRQRWWGGCNHCDLSSNPREIKDELRPAEQFVQFPLHTRREKTRGEQRSENSCSHELVDWRR